MWGNIACLGRKALQNGKLTQLVSLCEQARLAQLAKRAEYQDRQAAIAQDLPESKRWIDPAIIERNFKYVFLKKDQ